MKKKRYTVEELIHNPSFRDWVEGTTEFAETRQWDHWVGKSDENRVIGAFAAKSGLTF